MIIDVFSHWLTPRYADKALRLAGGSFYMLERAADMPPLTDPDVRFRIMDEFPDYIQILSMVSPPPEALGAPNECADLCRIGMVPSKRWKTSCKSLTSCPAL